MGIVGGFWMWLRLRDNPDVGEALFLGAGWECVSGSGTVSGLKGWVLRENGRSFILFTIFKAL
jgi:hypothetical protein